MATSPSVFSFAHIKLTTETMTVEEQIPTEAGAYTRAYDSLQQRLYVFLPSCRVAVYEESEVA